MAIYSIIIVLLTAAGFLLTETELKTKLPFTPGLCIYRKIRKKTVFLYLTVSFFILLLPASLRYAIGFDYFSYRDIYQITSDWPLSQILPYCWYEPLFFILCKIFCLCSLPFQIFITGISIFLLLSVMWFIYHYSKLPWMSIYLFITLQFYAYDMNLMRQAVAVCFFLFAYPYLKDRKIIPYSILIITGGLFHNSLWFIYPLYFLLPGKISGKTVLHLGILTGFGYLFFDPLFFVLQPLLPEKYALYQQTYFWNSNTWEYLFPPAVYCLLIYLFRHRITDTVRQSIYLNSALLNLLISIFITKHFILERFAVYPFVFSLAAIPEIAASFRPDSTPSLEETKTYHRVILLFMLFGGAYFLFAAAKGFHHVYPYISLFDKSRSLPAF